MITNHTPMPPRAVLNALATAGVAKAVPADAHPDAALLAIGREFDTAFAAYLAFRPRYREADAAIEAAIEAAANDPGSAVGKGRSNEEQAVAYGAIFAPHDAVLKRNDALLDACGTLSEKAFAIVPQTLVGLAVQARCCRYHKMHVFDLEPDAREYDDQQMCRLIETLLNLVAAQDGGAQ